MADLGSDIAGIRDVDAALSVVTGRPALAQAILRRLTTTRGALPEDVTYGYDVTALIGSTAPMSIVEQRCREQALGEEEVHDASVAAALDPKTGTLQIALSVVASEGPFELTISVSEQLTIEAFINGSPFFQDEA